MKKTIGSLVAALLFTTVGVQAQEQDMIAPVRSAVMQHVLPGFVELADSTLELKRAAANDCGADSVALRKSWAAAFDAWVRVSHLRFGPTEEDNRAFALAFWPDSRGKTPKALSGLIEQENPIAQDPAAFSEFSIAAQGFYAMEFLLFDEVISNQGRDAYRCDLLRSIADGIYARAVAIEIDWSSDYSALLMTPNSDQYYRTDREALQELYKAALTGLEFTADSRLGRPLGTFDRPRPKRAEAWRSERSLHHIVLSLESLRALVSILAQDQGELADSLDASFAYALELASELDDPDFSGVSDPMGRFRVDILRQAVDGLKERVGLELGPALGVAAGFNALDGD